MCFQNEVSFLLPIRVGCPVFQVSQAWDANGQRFDQQFSAYDLPFSALHCTKVSLVVFFKDVFLQTYFESFHTKVTVLSTKHRDEKSSF